MIKICRAPFEQLDIRASFWEEEGYISLCLYVYIYIYACKLLRVHTSSYIIKESMYILIPTISTLVMRVFFLVILMLDAQERRMVLLGVDNAGKTTTLEQPGPELKKGGRQEGTLFGFPTLKTVCFGFDSVCFKTKPKKGCPQTRKT